MPTIARRVPDTRNWLSPSHIERQLFGRANVEPGRREAGGRARARNNVAALEDINKIPPMDIAVSHRIICYMKFYN